MMFYSFLFFYFSVARRRCVTAILSDGQEMMNENSRGNNMGRRNFMDPNNVGRVGMRHPYLNPSGPGPIPSIGN